MTCFSVSVRAVEVTVLNAKNEDAVMVESYKFRIASILKFTVMLNLFRQFIPVIGPHISWPIAHVTSYVSSLYSIIHIASCFKTFSFSFFRLYFSGRITCIRCGLLLQMTHVAWFVSSVRWSHECTLQKRLNRSRYRL